MTMELNKKTFLRRKKSRGSIFFCGENLGWGLHFEDGGRFRWGRGGGSAGKKIKLGGDLAQHVKA